MLKRNTPTLINAALQPALFYDTRVNYLEDQANEVITNKDEMHGSLQAAVGYLKNKSEYQELFQKAYPNSVISEAQVKNAIAAYIRSLIALDSRFDLYMRGKWDAMDQKDRNNDNAVTFAFPKHQCKNY